MELAIQHYNAGDLPKAEGVCRQILQADPKQPVALQMLGVIALQFGKYDIAAKYIKKAIEVMMRSRKSFQRLWKSVP